MNQYVNIIVLNAVSQVVIGMRLVNLTLECIARDSDH